MCLKNPKILPKKGYNQRTKNPKLTHKKLQRISNNPKTLHTRSYNARKPKNLTHKKLQRVGTSTTWTNELVVW